MSHKILLVDDDRLSRLFTLTILERVGFQVEVLSDGRDAADAEATGDFDAVIMDCQMPQMDGFQATAEIRRRQAERDNARTPIIGLSARCMAGDRETAIAKGMDVYITKPTTLSKMQAVLAEWVPTVRMPAPDPKSTRRRSITS